MKYLALHGVPIAEKTWEHLSIPLHCHQFNGLATPQNRLDWSLNSFVEEVLPSIDEQTILLGHDFGGVIAAMCAVRKKPAAIVLTGTALGAWWFWTRLSALPLLRFFFYDLFEGRLFVQLGHKTAPPSHISAPHNIPDWSQRMRTLAQQMRPPPRLAQQIPCPVYLIWGKRDRWYPPVVAKAIARATQAQIFWIEGGHYSMRDDPAAFQKALQTIRQEVSVPAI